MATNTDAHDSTDQQTSVALLFGAVLTLVGILGFTGILVSDNAILGIFGISPLHNVVHLLTGVAGLVAGYAGGKYGAEYNKYLGLTYIVVFVVGVIAVLGGISLIVDLLNLGWADNLLHLAIGVVLTGAGFGLGNR